MSWHHADIARFYSLRWLVEVFIQDWKAHGGWNKLSKQRGVEGSERGVILSLLCEHIQSNQSGLRTISPGCL